MSGTTKFKEKRRKINDNRQAFIQRVLAQHKAFSLSTVTWRTVLKPGWTAALQRLLPFTALALFFAPFTTVQSEVWHLVKFEGSQAGYLSAWDGPTWRSM
jgi:hypothetical protein